MLYEELKQKRNLVLIEKDKYKYILYALDKKELKLIEDDFEDYSSGVELECDFIKDVIMGGNIDETQDFHCKELIPLNKVHTIRPTERFEKKERIPEYKCYHTNELHIERSRCNNVIVHEDKLSSFKCACERIQSKYFVVVKEKKEIENTIITQLVNEIVSNEFLLNKLEVDGNIQS